MQAEFQGIVYDGILTCADDFCDLVRRIANGLQALGILENDAIAILMRNEPRMVASILAAQSIGCFPVLINWHGTRDEVAYVLSDCGAKALIAHADLVAGADDWLPRGCYSIVADVPAACLRTYRIDLSANLPSSSAILWESWLAGQSSAEIAAVRTTESIIYTSGTTGRPKGVRRAPMTPEQVEATACMRRAITGIEKGARVCVTAPIYHTAPQVAALRALREGELLIFPTRFEPEALLADIERYRITHLYAVPTMFTRLLKLPQKIRAFYDLESLRFVLHAGAPCANSLKREMIDWLGPIVNEYYGSTELGPISFVTSGEWLARPGTVGKPVEGMRVEIRDSKGQSLLAGQSGEICARNVFYSDFTYLNRPEDRARLDRGGLLATGDIGHFDDEGYLYIDDRISDMVISGGVNIYPAEIEQCLLAIRGICDCVVFGVPDIEYGESLVALVVTDIEREALHPEWIAKELRMKLSGYKIPRSIEFRDRLPREASGKIKKRLVRREYLAQHHDAKERDELRWKTWI